MLSRNYGMVCDSVFVLFTFRFPKTKFTATDKVFDNIDWRVYLEKQKTVE